MEFSTEQLVKLGVYEELQSRQNDYSASKAYEILRGKINSKADLFCMLSATNLLNALIKRPDCKKRFSYSFKRFLAKSLEDIITNRKGNLYDSIHYDKGCIYVRCYSLQFSFHNLMVNKNCINDLKMSGLDSGEPWDGLRLQPYAEEIFNTSVKIKQIKQEEGILIEVQRLKEHLICESQKSSQ